MMLERAAQVVVVLAALGLGYALTGGSRSSSTEAQGAKSGTAGPGLEARRTSPQRVERPGWRRPAVGAETFEAALIIPDDLPADEPRPVEDRDPAWAAPMESALNTMLAQRLARVFPEATATVHCRRTTCRVEVITAAALEEKVTAYLALAVPLGPTTESSWDRSEPPMLTTSVEVDLQETPTMEAWQRWVAAVDSHMQPEVDRILAAEKDGTPWFPDQ